LSTNGILQPQMTQGGIMSRTTTASCTLAILFCAGSLYAEPISIVYSIHITERCRADGCTAFSTTFPLTMTFDSGATSQFDSPGEHNKFYGPPKFSTVPLDRPAVAPGASALRQTADIAFEHAPGRWRHVAHAQELFQLVTSQFDFRWNLSLYGVQDGFLRPPQLSPASMATFLGRRLDLPDSAGFFGYSYSRIDLQHTDENSPDAIAYQGFALVAGEPSPVPEPATCVLVGASLLGVWYRQRRPSPVRR
jgi:hypothetical protein